MADLVLYDGVCGLCNRLTVFLLRRDSADRYRFAALQSQFANALLAKHNINAATLDSVVVIADYSSHSERVLVRSRAVIHVLGALGGGWSLIRLAAALPTFLTDAIYGFVAHRRYRLFGRYDTCALPSPEHRAKFISDD